MAKSCKDCIHSGVCVLCQLNQTCLAFKNKADVVEVRHGVWVEHFSFGVWHYDCPFCDDGYATKERDNTPPNYCPNCGAKMDGGVVE
jgi:hypothetical protein